MMHSPESEYAWLPGRLLLTRGNISDYESLARFHYCSSRPATFAMILALRFLSSGEALPRTVAVGVLSHPPLRCHARERVLSLQDLEPATRHRVVNQNLRTISRIIVHPQFRGVGLASHLVRTLCALAGTPWVESIARMGNCHPLFKRAAFAHCSGDYFLRRYLPAASGGAAGEDFCRRNSPTSTCAWRE